MRNEATIKVFSPAAINKHASQPHKFRPDRCYLLLNQIFVDPSFVQICPARCVRLLSLSLSMYLLSLFLSLSRHNYTLPRVNGERSCLRFEWYAAPDFDVEGGRGEVWKLSDISKWNICERVYTIHRIVSEVSYKCRLTFLPLIIQWFA